MNPQETSIKHSALGWVKKSIDDNLAEIKTDLKHYIEAEDEALLEGVKEGLGVIQGVLVMIEQYGAAMLTEEMVALADFIIANKQEQGEQALEVMLRAVLQLPDYLEHIQSGHRDIPIAILPLLNDIRAVRNQDLFSEKLLFLPDLSMHQEDADVQPIDNDSNQASKLLVKKLRPIYQLALVNIIKEQSVEESLKRLEKVCETLEERSASEQIARIWWIVGALIESVSRQQIELGVSVKNLLGKVDALFRVILIIGESGLLQRQPIELIKNFLFYIAQPECDGPKAQAIKIAYRLEQFLPSESARSEVLDNIAGPNQALLKTVAEAMKADIELVKSTLEVYVNGDLSRVEELKDLPQEMHVISDTLAMIGLGSQRQLIEAQTGVVKEILAGNQVTDEEQLLSMAAELLQVEHALDQMQKRQPVSPAPRSEADVSRDYELDSVLTAVVTAALDDIQKAKHSILEFIKDSSRSENIELCIALMEESRGALQLLNQHRAAAVVEGLLTYLKYCDIVDFMDTQRLDALSQVVVSLEYYLESLGEHRSDADSILDAADTQLQELLSKVQINSEAEGHDLVIDAERLADDVAEEAPVAAESDKSAAVVQFRTESGAQNRTEPPVETEPVVQVDSIIDIDQAEAEAEPVVVTDLVIDDQPVDQLFEPASPADEALTTEIETISVPVEKTLEVVSVDEELEVLKSGSDPEILEIYLEEAEEESLNIARLQQDWLLHPEDENAVKNMRRAFHTIKGSGRLVGAMKIGEFAWDFEQLLNRVIDKTIPPDKRVIGAVGDAAAALAELVLELKTSAAPETDINHLRGLARALAEFKAERLLFEHTHRAPTQESSYDRITDSEETEWKGFGVGATTQIIPPDKLTEAMLEEIEPDTVQVDPAAFEINQAHASSEGPDLGDTLLAQPPQIPGAENYTQAVDYAQAGVKQTRAEAAGPEASEFEELESAARETIKIETVGEDFLGDDFDDDFGDEEALEASEPESLKSESEIPDESEIESPPVVAEAEVEASSAIDELEFDAPADTDESEIEISSAIDGFEREAPPAINEFEVEAPSVIGEVEAPLDAVESEEKATPVVDEIEFDEVFVQAATATDEEMVMETLEPEIEAEEIVMETPALEDEEIVTQAAELEAEEIEFEALEPEADAQYVQTRPQADEIGIGTTESSEIDAGVKEEEAEDQEDTPDPLVDTTGDQMPGDEAGDSEPRAQEPLEPTGLSFDPELLTIYQQEVEQHLGIVSSALDYAEQIQELVPSEELYRALHTIHGASRTADISTIGELASLMEKPLKLAISQKMALDQEIVALYREGQRALNSMTEELVSAQRLPEISPDLKISFIALAEDFEEYTVEIPEDEVEPTGGFIDTLTMMSDAADTEQDNELLTIFVDEANELLEMSDNTLHEWSQQELDDTGAQDYGAVMELQRYLHTLKGGARMAELKEISDLSHEMESLFIAVIDGRVDRNDNLIELLKDCFDLLHRQVVEAQDGQEMSDCTDLIGLLRDLRRGDNDQLDEEFNHDGAMVDMDMDSEAIDIVSRDLSAELFSDIDRSSQDVIKVRSDLLDNLVNAAGEVSIYRARMEQQVAGLGSHLGELGQTIARLKGQLRNLEAETDAQIHFSHRTESGKVGEFDPLEMDRYTMIQELSRSLGESVNDLSSLQGILGEQVKDSETLLLQQSRVNTDLQDGLIKSRMVKFSGLLSRLRRLVRQSSQELGKKAELIISGEENEVDNKVLDRMVAPLEHIIRNALSHGIETPVERVKKGKAESGKIKIDIARDGSDIVIRVSDDGAGVSIEKVRSRAIQLGLLEKSHEVSEADLVQYILEPGFSTAEHVTQMSGRGIGMDVVDIEIKQLGGTLQIATNPQGTTFIARLPFTLSINQAILVRTGEETYAIPLINIEGITRLSSQQMLDYYRQEEPELEYAGQQFALHNLSKLVGLDAHFKPGSENEKQAIILSRAGDVRVALHVDEIIGNREIVVKTLGKQLSQVKALAGASILADGSVVLILDINGLIRHSATSAVKIVYQPGDDRTAKIRSMVMVVDDSITMRRVASKLLERHNYEVVTAKDGVDALAQLQDLRPDVMLLDIEMPRMDGFELAAHMQNEESFSEIPIIMITSRTGEKHRDRALEIGVTNYMGKPYQEDELIENIQTALGSG
jgi:chemosensory pili system protein ChpA (sensor histidine kinase/response regulator)